MQRHMKLILKLLEHATEQSNGEIHVPELDGYSVEQVQYHVELCSQAGYMKVRKLTGQRRRYRIVSVTWQGHEALLELRERFSEE